MIKYKVISGDLQHSQSSASFHNFESDAVSYFNPEKTVNEFVIFSISNMALSI
jgi:hypothetical protein